MPALGLFPVLRVVIQNAAGSSSATLRLVCKDAQREADQGVLHACVSGDGPCTCATSTYSSTMTKRTKGFLYIPKQGSLLPAACPATQPADTAHTARNFRQQV